jgi:centrosomal protein CEP290
VIEKLNQQIEDYRDRISKQDNEMNSLLVNLENQKQLSSKSPSAAIKSMVDKLKQQLAEKEEQQQILNKALLELKSDMVNMAKINLNSVSQDQSQEKNLQTIINKACNEYQDKIIAITEDNNKLKADLKNKQKTNDELNIELEHIKSQLS